MWVVEEEGEQTIVVDPEAPTVLRERNGQLERSTPSELEVALMAVFPNYNITVERHQERDLQIISIMREVDGVMHGRKVEVTGEMVMTAKPGWLKGLLQNTIRELEQYIALAERERYRQRGERGGVFDAKRLWEKGRWMR